MEPFRKKVYPRFPRELAERARLAKQADLRADLDRQIGISDIIQSGDKIVEASGLPSWLKRIVRLFADSSRRVQEGNIATRYELDPLINQNRDRGRGHRS